MADIEKPVLSAITGEFFDRVVASAEVLKIAGVDFGIMGKDEVCCGSTAMRVGMKGLFLEQAGKNIEKINSLGVEQVVTACAGCYGIMKLSYPGVATL